MNPSLHHKSPCTPHTFLSSCIHRTMSQEGANLPQEMEGSHGQATAPHAGSIPAGDGSPTATVMPAGSNSSSVSELASAVNNAGSSERASTAVLSPEDNNAASAKIASPAVLHAGDDDNTEPKIASPTELLAGEEKGNDAAGSKLPSPAMLHDCDNNKAGGSDAGVDNNAARSKLSSLAVLGAGDGSTGGSKIAGSPAVPHTTVDKTTGSKLASPVMLQERDNNKAGSQAGVDGNAARSKLAIPAVLHAGDGTNGGSKIASPAVPQAIVDNTTGSTVDSPAELHGADEHNDAGFKVPNPCSKDMDNNARPPKFASPGSVLLHAGEENKARTKLAVQAVSHAGGNVGSSRLTRSAAAAALQAAKDNISKLTIQVVPTSPQAGKDSNAGSSSSKAATRPAAVDAGESNTKEGKSDVGGGRGKGNAATVEDADANLHIFTERERRKKMKNMFSTLHGLLPKLPDKADKATIVGETIIYVKTLERKLERLQKLKMERQRALAVQQQLQHGQQQQVLVGAAPALPAPAPAAPASSSREASLADMVHGLQAQQQAAANTALVTAQAAAAAAAAAGAAGGSSSSAAGAQPLPRGTVPFPAPAAGFQTWTGHNAVVSVANNEAYINLRCPREIGTLTKALFVLERNHIEVVTTTISTQDGFRMYGIHARVNPASASARFPENLCAEDRFKLAVSEMVEMINNV